MACRRSAIKNAFRGYRTMTPVLRSKLKEWGFTVIRTKRHIILRYDTGKDAAHIVISQTASDSRTGNNISSRIARILDALE